MTRDDFKDQLLNMAEGVDAADEAAKWRTVAQLPDDYLEALLEIDVHDRGWDADQILEWADRRADGIRFWAQQEAAPTIRRGKARKTLALRDVIESVMQDIPGSLSTRQVFYQLVQRGTGANLKKFERRVFRSVLEMRRDGTIPYERIVDRTRGVHKLPGWDGEREMMMQAATQFRRDLWQDQPVVVHVACEKRALAGIFAEGCDEYGAALYTLGGFNSESFTWEWSNDIKALTSRGKKVVIAYFGDHDPSGLDLERDAQKRLRGFGAVFEWRRAGLLLEDFDLFDVVKIPVKRTDARAKAYLNQFGDVAAELDALSPVELRKRIADEITAHIDVDRWNRLAKVGEAQKETLEMVAGNWDAVLAAARGAA